MGESGAFEERRVLDIALDAGHILLQNGAEIARVEETMERICRHYGVSGDEFFVLSNGIFATSGHDSGKSYARVQHIPVKGARLDKVIAVNQLSRDIEAGICENLETVEERLDDIKRLPSFSAGMQILASGVGSGFFCVLAGGGPLDCVSACIAGVLLFVFILYVSAPHLGRIVGNILGGFLVVLISLACYRIGLGADLSHMISGAIMPLIPGTALTNGVRDIANGDYISGIVRMLDALFVFLSIAIGVGAMFTIYHAMTGGIMP